MSRKVVDLKSGKDLESALSAKEVESQEDFSTVILNASMDGILTYDVESRYTLWNPSMEKITGLKSKDVLGRCAFDVFPFLREVGLDKHYAATLRGEEIRSPIFRYTVPQTDTHGYCEQQNFPLFDEEGKVSGGMAIVRDVTLIKRRFDLMAQTNRALEDEILALEKKLAELDSRP